MKTNNSMNRSLIKSRMSCLITQLCSHNHLIKHLLINTYKASSKKE